MFYKKYQASIEYLVIIGFVSFAVLSIVFLAYLYSGTAKDKIRDNEIETFATKIINSAEAVFYSGEPSQVTILVYEWGAKRISNYKLKLWWEEYKKFFFKCEFKIINEFR